MHTSSPVQIPVELRREARWFRLAQSVSPDAVALTSAVPDELTGAMEIAFQLPGELEVVRCRARAQSVTLGAGEEERRERRELRFLDLSLEQRGRIERYLAARGAVARG